LFFPHYKSSFSSSSTCLCLVCTFFTPVIVVLLFSFLNKLENPPVFVLLELVFFGLDGVRLVLGALDFGLDGTTVLEVVVVVEAGVSSSEESEVKEEEEEVAGVATEARTDEEVAVRSSGLINRSFIWPA